MQSPRYDEAIYASLYLVLWTHTWNKARCRSTYIMVHPRRKISSVYLHPVRERSAKKGAAAAAVAEGHYSPHGGFSRGRRRRAIEGERLFTSLNYIVADSARLPGNAVGHIGQGRIVRGLHNGESWLQRRAAEANCQTRETAFEERAANNDASSLQMCNIALMREVQSAMAKMARGCQFSEMFYLAKFACASKCEIKAL